MQFDGSSSCRQRANAATLMCCFQVIVLGKTGDEAFKPFATVYPPFLPYRDATCASKSIENH